MRTFSRFHLKLMKKRLSWERKQMIPTGWCVDLETSDFSNSPLNIIKSPLKAFECLISNRWGFSYYVNITLSTKNLFLLLIQCAWKLNPISAEKVVTSETLTWAVLRFKSMKSICMALNNWMIVVLSLAWFTRSGLLQLILDRLMFVLSWVRWLLMLVQSRVI